MKKICLIVSLLLFVLSSVIMVGCGKPKEPSFLDYVVVVTVRDEYRDRAFRLDDFKEIGASGLKISIREDSTSIDVYLLEPSHQNVLDAIEIVKTYDFVERAATMRVMQREPDLVINPLIPLLIIVAPVGLGIWALARVNKKAEKQ